MREFSLVSLVVGASLELCGAGFSSWGPGLCGAGSVAGAAASVARAQWLGLTGSSALWHVGSSWTRD